MKVLITGPGRGGTNWTTEIVRCSPMFKFSSAVEDRSFFTRKRFDGNYATKLAIENAGFTWKNIDRVMTTHEDLMIIFSIRHPLANAMAKIVRGQPSSKGGDASNKLAPDATVEGAVASLVRASEIYSKLVAKYPSRVLLVKLEDLIENLDVEIDRLCGFLDIEFNDVMLNAHTLNRNKYQKKRYGDKIDKSQATIHTNWQTAYDGFFKNKENQIKVLKKKLGKVMMGFSYE